MKEKIHNYLKSLGAAGLMCSPIMRIAIASKETNILLIILDLIISLSVFYFIYNLYKDEK